MICQAIEGKSLREVVVDIDVNNFLRRFVGIDHGPMMNFTALCRFKNAVCPKTWKKINRCLAKYAVKKGLIRGERLRLDTTLIETNIHWPTDSGLLWDTYRTCGRLITAAREIDEIAVGDRRLQTKTAKRAHTWLARKAGKKGTNSPAVKDRYKALIGLVEGVSEWAVDVAQGLRKGLKRNRYGTTLSFHVEAIIEELEYYVGLGEIVLHQARTRVLEGKQVAAEDKIYSIFEPHTELIKRGKAGKSVEFGHMINLAQSGKFISDYSAFEKKPVEHELVEPVLKRHKELFGSDPEMLAADKAFYESREKIEELSQRIETVGIAKKGSRTDEEDERESSFLFKLAQRFRAGVEGSISFVKHALRLLRCFNKGWEHFEATVGMTVFAHNLLILARGGG